jgi:ribonuclease HI
MPGIAVLHVDGGAGGAPGPAAIGNLVDDQAGARLAEHAEAIGPATAAEAKYRALLAGSLSRAAVSRRLRLAEQRASPP